MTCSRTDAFVWIFGTKEESGIRRECRIRVHGSGRYCTGYVNTDAELIAIQLRTGTKSANALELAKQLLAAHDNNLYRLYADLLADVNAEQNISGLGAVKRLSVLAAQELGVRTYVASVEEKQREGAHHDEPACIYNHAEKTLWTKGGTDVVAYD